MRVSGCLRQPGVGWLCTGTVREAIRDQMAAIYPPFTACQANTGREIPVVEREPVR